MTGNLSQTVWQWMKSLGIPVSKTLLRNSLEQHPDYPSALSITDTLKGLGIDNMAIQIEKENLPQVPVPFLAHVNSNGGDFVLINNPLLIADSSAVFYKTWSGVVIAAEKPESFTNTGNLQAVGQE